MRTKSLVRTHPHTHTQTQKQPRAQPQPPSHRADLISHLHAIVIHNLGRFRIPPPHFFLLHPKGLSGWLPSPPGDPQCGKARQGRPVRCPSWSIPRPIGEPENGRKIWSGSPGTTSHPLFLPFKKNVFSDFSPSFVSWVLNRLCVF